jgi:hypothetical protein
MRESKLWVIGIVLVGATALAACTSIIEARRGDGGTPDATGSGDGPCMPTTCQAANATCGSLADGCGGTLECGTCAAPATCGGGGTAHECGCTPTTCQAQGKNCGTMPDGCTGTLTCGTCTGTETCGGGNPGTPNVCGEGPCTTGTTCAAQQKSCGTISDGCGDTLECGTCTSPAVCGGGGVANVCGCTPTTCQAQSKNCGDIDNGCGTSLHCGDCTGQETCGGGGVANVCGGGPTVCGDGAIPSGGCTCGGTVYTSGSCCGGVHQTSACAPPDLSAWLANLPTLSNGLKWMPGVPGGIPSGTLDTTLTSGQMTANQINAAITAASGRGSASNIRVVQLPAGTFSLSGWIYPANYVILRGAGAWGSGRTRLNFNSDGAIRTNWPTWPSSAQDLALSAGGTLAVGSTSIPVTNGSQFAVGDLIQIDQLDDLSYVAIGDAGYSKRAPFPDGPYAGPLSPDGFRSVVSMHQVTAVSGNTLTVDPPTRIEYDYYSKADGTTRLRPEVWRVAREGTDGLWHFGLEQVSIAGPQYGAIVYEVGAFNWVKDVETDGQSNGGVSGDHVALLHQFRSEIRRVYAHHTTGGPWSGGANYGILLEAATSECLVIDCIVRFMNKLIQSAVCGPGNVIAYNYADNTSADGGGWMDGAINGSHQSFSHHLLVEGNWSANLGCDTTHGNSGYMAFLRNYSQGYSTDYNNEGNLRAANADGWSREMAYMGNVLHTAAGASYEENGTAAGPTVWSIGQYVQGSGDRYDGQTTRPPPNDMEYSGQTWDSRQPTFTTKAKDKLWRHGNWDAVHASIADWDPSYPDHVIPTSLFLSAAPSFFGANAWPWIDSTGSAANDRVKTLPAKARFDANTPFAP